MVMRAKFPAGSEQEITSIVTALQAAGYATTQISKDEIELDRPTQARAEEIQSAAGFVEPPAADTSSPPQAMGPNLPVPDYPEIPQREFVLAPLFRRMGASVSDRFGMLYRYLRQGWSARTQRVNKTGRALSSHASVCWGMIAQSFASGKRAALQLRPKLAPPDRQKQRPEEKLLTASRRAADRFAFALAGATVIATLIVACLILAPHGPTPAVMLPAIQSTPAPKPGSAPMAPHSVAAWPTVAHTLPKPSPVLSTRRIAAAHRRAAAEDDVQDVTVRQFPQRRTQPPLQQAAGPIRISDLDK